MNPNDLTPEQRTDIEERVKRAKEFLEVVQLEPHASVQAINTGNDVFATKVIVYLQDLKFLSPITKKDV